VGVVDATELELDDPADEDAPADAAEAGAVSGSPIRLAAKRPSAPNFSTRSLKWSVT
jgi:hypothetical protein